MTIIQEDRIRIGIVIIVILVIFAVSAMFVRQVAMSRLGQKIEYWMSEPNDIQE